MSEWAARRFWDSAAPCAVAGGWGVTLDGRALRTPGKQALILPTAALAAAVAAEWNAQEGIIAPMQMPLTRAVNSAVERVRPQRADVVALVAEYGATDLLCYRAEAPDELIARQAEAWDPLLAWAADALAARLRVGVGVVPVRQEAAALANLAARVAALDPFRLTALHDLVTLPGSLVLGLAVLDGRLTATGAHALANVDEEFQAAQWGRDDEAEAAAAARLDAMVNAERLLFLLND